MPKGDNTSKPGEASLRWNKTPRSLTTRVSKSEKDREARRAQIAYEIERSMAKRCPMQNIKGDRPVEDWEDEEAA
jgi:hypothetical protein